MRVSSRYQAEVTIARFRDGDTLEAFVSCHCCGAVRLETIRLPRIDSYEPSGDTLAKAQAIAEDLTSAYRGVTGALVSNKLRRDRYGRLLADVHLGTGLLSVRLVEEGYAWFGVGNRQPSPYSS